MACSRRISNASRTVSMVRGVWRDESNAVLWSGVATAYLTECHHSTHWGCHWGVWIAQLAGSARVLLHGKRK